MFKKFVTILSCLVILTASLAAVGCGGGGGGGISGAIHSALKKFTVKLSNKLIDSASIRASVRASDEPIATKLNFKAVALTKNTIVAEQKEKPLVAVDGETHYVTATYDGENLVGDFENLKPTYMYKLSLVTDTKNDSSDVYDKDVFATIISASNLNNGLESTEITEASDLKVKAFQKWTIVSGSDDKSIDNFEKQCKADGLKEGATEAEQLAYYKAKAEDYDKLKSNYDKIAKELAKAVANGYELSDSSIASLLPTTSDFNVNSIRDSVKLEVLENVDNIVTGTSLFKVNDVKIYIKTSPSYTFSEKDFLILYDKIQIKQSKGNPAQIWLGAYTDAKKSSVRASDDDYVIGMVTLKFTTPLEYDTDYEVYLSDDSDIQKERTTDVVTDNVIIKPFKKYSFKTASEEAIKSNGSSDYNNIVSFSSNKSSFGFNNVEVYCQCKFTSSDSIEEAEKGQISEAVIVEAKTYKDLTFTKLTKDEDFYISWDSDNSFVVNMSARVLEVNTIFKIYGETTIINGKTYEFYESNVDYKKSAYFTLDHNFSVSQCYRFTNPDSFTEAEKERISASITAEAKPSRDSSFRKLTEDEDFDISWDNDNSFVITIFVETYKANSIFNFILDETAIKGKTYSIVGGTIEK